MNFKHLETAQKLRGGYYTPLPIADFLCGWAVTPRAKTILEPSCGDGVFLSALQTALHGRNRQRVTIDAVELLPEEARKASARAKGLRKSGVLATVHDCDFFSWINQKPLTQTWDVVLGNPPYIRYQYFDREQQDASRRIFDRANIPFSKLTNAWVPFVIASATHLAPGGRMALVIPAEAAYIQHADGLRRFLEQEMILIRIVYLRKIVFEGTLQGTILFLGEKRQSRSTSVLVHRQRRESSLFPVSASQGVDFRILDVEGADDLARVARNGSLTPSDEAPIVFNGQWMMPLLNRQERDLLDAVCSHGAIHRFASLARVDIGIVTGANKFFCVDEATVAQYGLRKIAFPMLARSTLMRGITYTKRDHKTNAAEGRPVNFLRFPHVPVSKMSKKMADYIRVGEKMALPSRYKCRIREPWYEVPYVWTSEIAMLKRCHLYPRLVMNTMEAFSTDTAYRVRLKDEFKNRARDFVFSFLNSLTFLFAELGGRHYAGGVLELVPSEIEPLPIPLVRVKASDFRHVDKLIRAGTGLRELLDYTDPIILGGALGLSRRIIDQIRQCYLRIQARRLRTANPASGATAGLQSQDDMCHPRGGQA